MAQDRFLHRKKRKKQQAPVCLHFFGVARLSSLRPHATSRMGFRASIPPHGARGGSIEVGTGTFPKAWTEVVPLTMWGPQDSLHLVYNYNFARIHGSYDHICMLDGVMNQFMTRGAHIVKGMGFTQCLKKPVQCSNFGTKIKTTSTSIMPQSRLGATWFHSGELK